MKTLFSSAPENKYSKFIFEVGSPNSNEITTTLKDKTSPDTVDPFLIGPLQAEEMFSNYSSLIKELATPESNKISQKENDETPPNEMSALETAAIIKENLLMNNLPMLNEIEIDINSEEYKKMAEEIKNSPHLQGLQQELEERTIYSRWTNADPSVEIGTLQNNTGDNLAMSNGIPLDKPRFTYAIKPVNIEGKMMAGIVMEKANEKTPNETFKKESSQLFDEEHPLILGTIPLGENTKVTMHEDKEGRTYFNFFKEGVYDRSVAIKNLSPLNENDKSLSEEMLLSALSSQVSTTVLGDDKTNQIKNLPVGTYGGKENNNNIYHPDNYYNFRLKSMGLSNTIKDIKKWELKYNNPNVANLKQLENEFNKNPRKEREIDKSRISLGEERFSKKSTIHESIKDLIDLDQFFENKIQNNKNINLKDLVLFQKNINTLKTNFENIPLDETKNIQKKAQQESLLHSYENTLKSIERSIDTRIKNAQNEIQQLQTKSLKYAEELAHNDYVKQNFSNEASSLLMAIQNPSQPINTELATR